MRRLYICLSNAIIHNPRACLCLRSLKLCLIVSTPSHLKPMQLIIKVRVDTLCALESADCLRVDAHSEPLPDAAVVGACAAVVFGEAVRPVVALRRRSGRGAVGA